MKQKLRELLDKPIYIWQKQYLQSKNIKNRKAPAIPVSMWKTIYYKAYVRLEEYLLPKPQNVKDTFHEIVTKRKSGRDFPNRKLLLSEISTLLHYGFGINEGERRFYPSGGARYPLEAYIVSINSELPEGIYHYYVKKHSLEKLAPLDPTFMNSVLTQKNESFKKASLFLIITSIWDRSIKKYGPRGYHYAFIEAGHAVQNVLLTTSALHLISCPIGGYDEDEIHQALDIDGIRESVIYCALIG
jgi:SagB-type dehydrogenase family enzyme